MHEMAALPSYVLGSPAQENLRSSMIEDISGRKSQFGVFRASNKKPAKTAGAPDIARTGLQARSRRNEDG